LTAPLLDLQSVAFREGCCRSAGHATPRPGWRRRSRSRGRRGPRVC
jgi:hypothetical protein